MFVSSDGIAFRSERKSLTWADTLPLVDAHDPEPTTAVTCREHRTRLRPSGCGRNRRTSAVSSDERNHTVVPARGDSLPGEGIWRGLPWIATWSSGQIFFVNGKNPLLTRESTDPTPVMAIFGGTTEIMKEIIGRGLGRASGRSATRMHLRRN